MTERRRIGGFTLIEMLVVLAIIAVLASILLPVFARAREKARRAQCISNLTVIATAMKNYWQDHRLYPPPPTAIDADGDGAADTYVGGISSLMAEGLVQQVNAICPNDANVRTHAPEAAYRYYSSYNECYNAYGYYDNTTPGMGGEPVTAADAIDGTNWAPNSAINGQNTTGIESLSKFPRLSNRYAPDNTVITHCKWHRFFDAKGTDDAARAKQMDMAMSLGGHEGQIKVGQWDTPESSGAVPWCYQPSNF